VVGKKPVGPSLDGVWHRVVRGNSAYLTATRFRHFPRNHTHRTAAIVQNNFRYSTMSRFWAAESSSDDDQGSDSDASSHQEPIVRQSDRKFGSTFEESDSGK
jgi:hypothetical protein